jgi:hypothetical protein
LGSDGGGYYSFHHNLVAHNLQRSPNISANGGPVDVANNLVYNAGGIGARVHNDAQVNFVGNYIKAGPNTHMSSFVKDDGALGFYLSGNVIEGNDTIKSFLPSRSADRLVSQPYPSPTIKTTSAKVAYDEVLQSAGASYGLNCDGSWSPRRDSIDERIVQSVLSNTRGHSANTSHGYIDSPSQVGGWPAFDTGTPCPDADHDGMPDEWESIHGLNPNRDDSAGDRDSDGYTNIEEYINGTSSSSQQVPLNSSIFLPQLNK